MSIVWYFNRLRAMSVREVLWRLNQKELEKAERRVFGKQHRKLTDGVFDQEKEDLRFYVKKLPIAVCGDNGGEEAAPKKRVKGIGYNRCISLLGGYDYEKYRKDWHAGFQTENHWPLDFAYDLKYKQRDEIGDARTSWELNRHFQFALLACSYYRSGKEDFLTELSELFEDWNEKNPFLHGISWTSVMEIAIRDINWIYTLGFLTKALDELEEKSFSLTDPVRKNRRKDKIESLSSQLRIGIINMTTYISAHYSRYSSANNHVIVEAAAMGIAGIVMEQTQWEKTAVSILNDEIPRQNYADGVNKEVSLHYQSFFMEAVGLLMLTMEKAERVIPANWKAVLQKMSRYMADCQGKYGETIVFGDDDAGKILDLEGVLEKECEMEHGLSHRNHYLYVLQLMSLLLPERYADEVTDASLLRMASTEKVEAAMKKPRYVSQGNICYEDGGVSILKSRDERVLIGIDHGELGFGSIAAHGHADALSFQMYLEGKAVFADAGTYIYHTDLESRNAFRSTKNHNTLTINGKDQSEMLGAFLWGKRAKTTLLWHNLTVGNAWRESTSNAKKASVDVDDTTVFYVEAEHDGYAPMIHRRKFVFDGTELKIYDSLQKVAKEISYELHFLLGNEVKVCCDEKAMQSSVRMLTADDRWVTLRTQFLEEMQKQEGRRKEPMMLPMISSACVSGVYGRKYQTEQICVQGKTKRDVTLVTTITWENNG